MTAVRQHQVTAFPNEAVVCTPNNSTVFDVASTIYVGGDGDVTVVAVAGDQTPVTFVGMKAGDYVPVRVAKVMSTGTTATNLVRIF